MTDSPTSVPPPPRPIELRDVDARGGWLSIGAGVVLVVLGLWLLANPFASVVILAMLIGASLIVGGVVEILGRWGSQELSWGAWVAGGLLVVTGLVILAWPDITLWAVAAVVGTSLVLAGLVGGVVALSSRDHPEWVAGLALGVLSVVVGLVALAWPDATVLILALLLGLRTLVTGLISIALGWQVLRLSS